MRLRSHFFGCIIGLLALTAPSRSEEPAAGGNVPNPLQGAWRVVSQRFGEAETDSPPAQGMEQIKFVIGERFEWTSSANGKIVAGGGGRCKIEGDTYTEHYDYVYGSEVEWLLGLDIHFNWKIEDRKWTNTGVLPTPQGDLKFSETCERLK